MLTLPLAADITWSWDFGELPAGWSTVGDWEFGRPGAFTDPSVTSYGDPETETCVMRSDTLVMPDSVSSVLVTVCDEWDWSGWFSGGGNSSAQISLMAYVPGGGSWVIEYDRQEWGYPRAGADSASVSIPVVGGDGLVLVFRAVVSAVYAHAELEWSITGLTVTGRVGQSLESATWAEVKRGFEVPSPAP